MQINEGEKPQFLASDSVGHVLEVYFDEVIPVLPLMAIKELVTMGTEDPADRECTYSRSLHLLCMAWLDAESLQGGFTTTREIANHRFSGVLWTACETGRRIDDARFSMDTFDELCVLASIELEASSAEQSV